MGILRKEQQAYYATDGAHGDYRSISLQDIIDSFVATYVGEGKICEKVSTQDVTFHAIRGLQELSYDTLRSTKDWEVEVPPSLLLVLPADYVNYVKLSWSDTKGIQRILYPAIKTSNPLDITETVETWGGFTISTTNTDLTSDESSDTWEKYKSSEIVAGTEDSYDTTRDIYNDKRYGLDPQFAQANGSFFIDESAGRLHFSSNLVGKTLILQYISDGIVTNAAGTALSLAGSNVPKLAEEAMYKHILYGVLLARQDTHWGMLAQIKKERRAETRKAKLRLSNIKLEELTQILRGASKIIKH